MPVGFRNIFGCRAVSPGRGAMTVWTAASTIMGWSVMSTLRGSSIHVQDCLGSSSNIYLTTCARFLSCLIVSIFPSITTPSACCFDILPFGHLIVPARFPSSLCFYPPFLELTTLFERQFLPPILQAGPCTTIIQIRRRIPYPVFDSARLSLHDYHSLSLCIVISTISIPYHDLKRKRCPTSVSALPSPTLMGITSSLQQYARS